MSLFKIVILKTKCGTRKTRNLTLKYKKNNNKSNISSAHYAAAHHRHWGIQIIVRETSQVAQSGAEKYTIYVTCGNGTVW